MTAALTAARRWIDTGSHTTAQVAAGVQLAATGAAHASGDLRARRRRTVPTPAAPTPIAEGRMLEAIDMHDCSCLCGDSRHRLAVWVHETTEADFLVVLAEAVGVWDPQVDMAPARRLLGDRVAPPAHVGVVLSWEA